jgi:GTP-binding protein EngB required for normal cell division
MHEPKSSLVIWYREAVRSLLEAFAPKRIESADAECARLESLEKDFSAEVQVCFLGASGIGKSALINALLGESLLPQGGIGPLTAQALCVRYGAQAALKAQYHSPGKVGRLAFALEKMYQAELRKQGHEVKEPSGQDLLELVDDEDDEASITAISIKGEEDAQVERNREFRKQATLMVAGRQDAEREIPYLIDRLRETVEKKPLFETTSLPDDQPRVERIRASLILGKKRQPLDCLESDAGFRTALHDHATGFLAPIINELVVFWNADLLRTGLVLTDLPGVGIAGDVHAKVTEQYIRERAKVVVLVVSVRGITKADAELLRNSGFLNRLLHAADDPAADPVKLMVVVVRADDIADTRYDDNKSRKRREHFADVCTEARQDAIKQLREHLTEAWRTDEKLSQTKQEVLDRIIDGLQVHALSAIQYRRLLANDEDNPAFIKEPEESNVPKFSRSLAEIAAALNRERQERLEKARNLFFSSVTSTIRVIHEQWVRETLAEEEAEALRKELDSFLEPIRKEFSTRRGEFRAFLRETVPSEIEKLVLEASSSARTAVGRYLKSLEDARWQTIKAAVCRGGTFHGSRHIDLPHDFALRFEEPVAEIWGKKLLQLIRRRTKTYAEDCIALVEDVLNWAKGKGARVNTRLVEAQHQQIKAASQQLTEVGKELINEMREEVKNRLVSTIRLPIRRRCERFVQKNQHIGAGVKLRMLDLFGELAEDAVAAAADPAKDLLTTRFKEVEKEIAKVLRSDEDPIDSAADAIVESHQAIVRRSDDQRRKKVLVQIDGIRAASPLPWPEAAELSEFASEAA